VLIEPTGAALVVAAFSEGGAGVTAALLAPDRPGLLWLGRRPAACRVYRIDGAPPPNRLDVRPAGRAAAARSLRRRGLSLADSLRAVWPLARPPRWTPGAGAYRRWIARNEPGPAEAGAIRAWLASKRGLPTIAILMVVGAANPTRLRAAIQSVRAQIHADWQLCISGPVAPSAEIRRVLADASADRRVRLIDATEAAADWAPTLDQAHAEFALSLGPEDLLAPHALAVIADALAADPDAVAAYADADLVDAGGRRAAPAFKPELDRAWLQTTDYAGAPLAVRRDVLSRVGGPGADLARRVADAGRGRVLHLPHVLLHIRSGATAAPPPGRALAFRRLAEPAPGVLAIVPTRDRPELLAACVAGLLDQTEYPALELCIVDNGSRTERALGLLARLECTPRVRVLRIDAPFNFSALNNAAAAGADARLLAFVNDDILVVEPHWLRAMADLAVLPDVGAVGAKLLYPSGSLQHGGIVLGLGPPRVAGHELRGAPGDSPGPQGRLQAIRQASAVTAACMVVERRKFEAVHGFDDGAFPVAFNDVDLCLRLAEAGYRTLWTPVARLIHLESATRGADRTGLATARFTAEAARMRERWGGRLEADPCYSPNLTLRDESFALAAASRARLPWR
jgi:GT2 family glycosyltransferase